MAKKSDDKKIDKAKINADDTKINRSAESQTDEQSGPTEVLDITTFAEYKKLQEELMLAKLATKESMEMVKNFKLDIDRIRERSEKANAEAEEKVTIEVAKKLLPIIDDFEKSLVHLKAGSDFKGINMLYTALLGILDSLSIKEIEAQTGVFNPEKMDAIMAEETSKPELAGTIAHVFRKGYYYVPTDKVIRYTQVSVYRA